MATNVSSPSHIHIAAPRGGRDRDQAAEAAGPADSLIGLAVENHAGEAPRVAAGPCALHEGGGGVEEAVKREQVHVGLHGEGPIHAVGRAVVARPGRLHPFGLVPKLAVGHVCAKEYIADGPVGFGATDVGDAEALDHFFAQRFPEEVLVLRRRGTGLGQDRGENVLLMTEELRKGRGQGNWVGAIREELLVADEARGVRALAGDVDRLKGDKEPQGAAVQQVEFGVHGLDRAVCRGSSGTCGRDSPRVRQRSMLSARECWRASTDEAVYKSSASMVKAGTAIDPAATSVRVICWAWSKCWAGERVSSLMDRKTPCCCTTREKSSEAKLR